MFSGQLDQLQANQAAGWRGNVNEDVKFGVKHHVAVRGNLKANMSDYKSRSPVSTALTCLKSHIRPARTYAVVPPVVMGENSL